MNRPLKRNLTPFFTVGESKDKHLQHSIRPSADLLSEEGTTEQRLM